MNFSKWFIIMLCKKEILAVFKTIDVWEFEWLCQILRNILLIATWRCFRAWEDTIKRSHTEKGSMIWKGKSTQKGQRNQKYIHIIQLALRLISLATLTMSSWSLRSNVTKWPRCILYNECWVSCACPPTSLSRKNRAEVSKLQTTSRPSPLPSQWTASVCVCDHDLCKSSAVHKSPPKACVNPNAEQVEKSFLQNEGGCKDGVNYEEG